MQNLGGKQSILWKFENRELLYPIGEHHLLSSFRGFVHDGYYLATFARFVHQAFLIRNEGTTDESKNVWVLLTGAFQFALKKLCF